LWVSVGVIAACFLLAWSLQLLSIRQAFIRSGPMPPPAIADNRDEERGETAPIHVDSDLPLDSNPKLADTETTGTVLDSEVDPDAQGEQQRLPFLLGRADVRRLVVVLDALRPEQLERIDVALHQVPRSDPFHARMSLGQGLAYDPRHPDDAVVFAVVL